jgi:hypothetical protein
MGPALGVFAEVVGGEAGGAAEEVAVLFFFGSVRQDRGAGRDAAGEER